MDSHATSPLSTAQRLSLVRSCKPTKVDTPLAKRIVSFPVLLGTRLRCGSSSQVSNCERQISMTESHAFGSNLAHLDQIHAFFDKVSLNWDCWPWEVCYTHAWCGTYSNPGMSENVFNLVTLRWIRLQQSPDQVLGCAKEKPLLQEGRVMINTTKLYIQQVQLCLHPSSSH